MAEGTAQLRNVAVIRGLSKGWDYWWARQKIFARQFPTRPCYLCLLGFCEPRRFHFRCSSDLLHKCCINKCSFTSIISSATDICLGWTPAFSFLVHPVVFWIPPPHLHQHLYSSYLIDADFLCSPFPRQRFPFQMGGKGNYGPSCWNC